MVNSDFGGANRAPNASSDVYGVAISCPRSPENSYLIDGLSVNDLTHGVNGSPLTVEFIDEVNIISREYMSEHGRSLGGALGATTRSGERVPRLGARARESASSPSRSPD
jgi:hypothetical protein